MNYELRLLDSMSFFLFGSILYFLSVISKRLGEVMGMKKYYYLYYIGIFLMFSASIVNILSFHKMNNLEPFFTGYVLFAAGLTFGLIALIKYWGWLIKEIFKG